MQHAMGPLMIRAGAGERVDVALVKSCMHYPQRRCEPLCGDDRCGFVGQPLHICLAPGQSTKGPMNGPAFFRTQPLAKAWMPGLETCGTCRR